MRFFIVLLMLIFTGVSATEVKVVGGYNQTIALKSNGTLMGWGDNDYNKLGLGETVRRTSLATVIDGVDGIIDIACGEYHTVALKSDGTLIVGGNNSDGQLGLGEDVSEAEFPTPLPNVTDIIAITANKLHTLALKSDGTVLAWGYDGNGQLGLGIQLDADNEQIYNYYTPTPISNSVANGITAISAGKYHTLALKSDGTMLAWGDNGSGRLGVGDDDTRYTPVAIPNESNITAISAGFSHSAALKDDGTMLVWGANYYGQLGLGNDGYGNDKLIPTIISSIDTISAIGASDSYTMAVRDDGTLFTWGYNRDSKLGLGDSDNRNLPTQVDGVDNMRDIATGWDHAIGINYDATLLAWGKNGSGQLGLGGISTRSVPTPIAEYGAGDILTNNIAISVGPNHAHTIQNDGVILGWGKNSNGLLGIGDTSNRSTPTAITQDYNITKISSGANHNIALKDDGTLLAWGYNNYGKLGLGDTQTQTLPTVIPDIDNIIAITAKSSSNIVLTNDGTMLAWGYNSHGQLGLGHTNHTYTPTLVPNETNITAVSAGGIYTIALKENGTLVSWGNNSYGQLGLDDNTSNHLIPTIITQDDNITAIDNIIAIETGLYHAIAIKRNGTLLAWGRNINGQLGDGTTTQQNRPVEVLGADNIIAVGVGDWHSLALKADGTLLAWGRNLYGPLGLGEDSTYSTSTPVAISGVDNVIAIAVDGYYNLALKSDGTILAWGYNAESQLGLGDSINRFSPEPIREFKVLSLLNATPTLNINTGSSLLEGASDILTSIELDFNDDASSDSNITYTVTTRTVNGDLKLNGITLLLNATFTQDDINTNIVTYLHNDSDTLSDSFIFKVSDYDGGEITNQTFGFTIIPVDDLDTDGDGIIDTIDTDDDNDGMSDDYENLYSLNPLFSGDADEDIDGDGFTNLEEYIAGTSPIDSADKPVSANPAVIMYLLD